MNNANDRQTKVTTAATIWSDNQHQSNGSIADIATKTATTTNNDLLMTTSNNNHNTPNTTHESSNNIGVSSFWFIAIGLSILSCRNNNILAGPKYYHLEKVKKLSKKYLMIEFFLKKSSKI